MNQIHKRLKRKKVEKVVKNPVNVKKKSKIAEILIDHDITFENICADIIVPATRDLILKIVEAALGVDSRPSTRRSNLVSYQRYYKERNGERDRLSRYSEIQTRPIDRHINRDDYVLATRSDAEAVLQSMYNLLDIYGIVSVADYHDLLGISGSFTDNKYGWIDLSDARVERPYGVAGYMIKMPKASPID